MIAHTPVLTQRPAWQALAAHHEQLRHVHLRELFADDPGRGERFAAEGAGLYLDYSKHRVTGETLSLLLQLARESPPRWWGRDWSPYRRASARYAEACCR